MPTSSSPPTFRDVLRYPWLFLAGVIAVLAGMVAAGFFAGLTISVLEAGLYAAIAGAVAGALTTRNRVRGAVVGVVACAGVSLGIIGYVEARSALFSSGTFWAFEFVVGILLGLVPGFVLWKRWFREAHDAIQPTAR